MRSSMLRMPPTPWHRSKTIGYYAAFVGLGMASAVLGPTLPGLAAQVGVTIGQIGLLFTVNALGYIVGTLAMGRLYDQMRGHTLMALTLAGMGFALLAVPFIPWLALLVVVVFMWGLTDAGVDVGGNTLILWQHGDRVEPFMNGLHFAFGAGAFLSPLIIAQVLVWTDDITGAYAALALVFWGCMLWLGRLPSPTPRDPDDEAATAGRPAPDVPLVFLLALLLALYVGAEVGMGGWIFTYAVQGDLLNERDAAYLTSAFWGALTLGRLLSIPVTARVRPWVILLVDLIGILLGLLWLGLVRETWAVWLGVILVGFSMATLFPTVLNFAEKRMRVTGRVTSYFFFGAGVGGMLLPSLIGLLIERFGVDTMMWALGANMLLGMVVFGAAMYRAARLAPAA
ncbi:MAG: MFS transporter [Anaerolineales bacterium]